MPCETSRCWLASRQASFILRLVRIVRRSGSYRYPAGEGKPRDGGGLRCDGRAQANYGLPACTDPFGKDIAIPIAGFKRVLANLVRDLYSKKARRRAVSHEFACRPHFVIGDSHSMPRVRKAVMKTAGHRIAHGLARWVPFVRRERRLPRIPPKGGADRSNLAQNLAPPSKCFAQTRSGSLERHREHRGFHNMCSRKPYPKAMH